MIEIAKFGCLILGLILAMIAKVQYSKRTRNIQDPTTPYIKSEKVMLYSGYSLMVLSVILVIIFN